MDRQLPEWTQRKQAMYARKATIWASAHYLIGFTSAILATIIAATAKVQGGIDPTLLMTIASFSAGLSFLGTGLNANKRSSNYDRASDVLWAAMIRYQLDPNVPDSTLGEAGIRALDILHGDST
jgi:hypothetical protein